MELTLTAGCSIKLCTVRSWKTWYASTITTICFITLLIWGVIDKKSLQLYKISFWQCKIITVISKSSNLVLLHSVHFFFNIVTIYGNTFFQSFYPIVCGILQGCLWMTSTALQQLTIFIAYRLIVQVAIYSGEQVVEWCALASQAKVHWFHKYSPSQSSNWGRRLAQSASQVAIPAFDHKAGLNNRHLNSNRGICLW
jgi:hypothetical protein